MASYTGIILTPESRTLLLQTVAGKVVALLQQGFQLTNALGEPLAHHMTINLGEIDSELNDPNILGTKVRLSVHSWGQDDKVAAVGVDSPVATINKTPHITIAVNQQNGGKPFMSNQITQWTPIFRFDIEGVIREI